MPKTSESAIGARLYAACLKTAQFKRIACYGLAKYHEKNTSTEHIVREIQHGIPGLDKDSVQNKLKRYLQIGRSWKSIIQLLADMFGTSAEDYLGLLVWVSSYTESVKPHCMATIELIIF